MVEALMLFLGDRFINFLTVLILFIAFIYMILIIKMGKEFIVLEYTYIIGFILFVLFNITLIYRAIFNEYIFRVVAYSLLLSSGLIILVMLSISKIKIIEIIKK